MQLAPMPRAEQSLQSCFSSWCGPFRSEFARGSGATTTTLITRKRREYLQSTAPSSVRPNHAPHPKPSRFYNACDIHHATHSTLHTQPYRCDHHARCCDARACDGRTRSRSVHCANPHVHVAGGGREPARAAEGRGYRRRVIVMWHCQWQTRTRADIAMWHWQTRARADIGSGGEAGASNHRSGCPQPANCQ